MGPALPRQGKSCFLKGPRGAWEAKWVIFNGPALPRQGNRGPITGKKVKWVKKMKKWSNLLLIEHKKWKNRKNQGRLPNKKCQNSGSSKIDENGTPQIWWTPQNRWSETENDFSGKTIGSGTVSKSDQIGGQDDQNWGGVDPKWGVRMSKGGGPMSKRGVQKSIFRDPKWL